MTSPTTIPVIKPSNESTNKARFPANEARVRTRYSNTELISLAPGYLPMMPKNEALQPSRLY